MTAATSVPAQRGLQAGECRITMTKGEWNVLHHLIAIAQERPGIFGGTADNEAAARVLAATLARLQAKLPPRGAGGYGG